jgi:DNA-binding MarR family transcriptional regulator
VGDRLPLPTLLSCAVVAYTIEFDNESEHRLPHRTASHGSTAGPGPKPWLVSLVMWANCMKYIGPDGVQLAELERLARTHTNLAGMQRWGYIVVTPGPTDRDRKRPGPDAIVRATPAGRRAQEIWGPLFGVIDDRWRERFGADAIADLRAALAAIADKLDLDLPECLPILGYGLFSASRHSGQTTFRPREGQTARPDGDANLPLSALLSRVLLALAIDFERDSLVSLAMSANVLRVLDEEGVRVRDLPTLTGVSKESVAMTTGYLEKQGYLTIEPVPAPDRGQRLRLTAQGRAAQQYAGTLVTLIEKQWQTRFGTDAVRALRSSLEPLVGDGTAQSPLFAGLEPYPDGWRAAVRTPMTLPHFPMVLHRGGFPDGS